MKRTILLIAASAIAAAAPASAAELLAGSTGVTFDQFSTVAGTRGTLLASRESDTSPATTYTGFLRSAVYRNSTGTLDFYYQVAVTTIMAGDEVVNLSAAMFSGYSVFAYVDTTDFDGAGIFTAAANPQTTPNETGGFTSTASRNGAGGVIRADFGANGLEAAGQTSATYIFRTNAANFNELGTFTAQDGSVAQRPGYQPIGAAVPEPTTWGMLLMGFGMIGFGLRARKTARVSFG